MSSVKVLTFPTKGREAKKNPTTHGENHSKAQVAFQERVTKRRTAIIDREVARELRSPQEQLALLDGRPGNSNKERARLEAMVKSQKLEAAVAEAKPKTVEKKTGNPKGKKGKKS